jgi:hypothetical protein
MMNSLDWESSTDLMIAIQPLVPFIAVGKHIIHPNGTRELQIDNCFCDEKGDKMRYMHYAKYKLNDVIQRNYMSYYSSQLGNWYIKGYKGTSYIVVTSDVYPKDIAIEIVDELYETIRRIKRTTFGSQKRAMAVDTCCRGVMVKYGTLEEGSAAFAIMTEMPDARDPYAEKIEQLMEKVDQLQDKMHDNILDQLKNIETAESIQKKSEECMELAKVFKKRATKLKNRTWYNSRRGLFIGTTVFSIVGGVGGFMVGGPAGAAALTGMSSIAAAQAIEATAGAFIMGVAFLGASSAFETWFLNQRFSPIRQGGVMG